MDSNTAILNQILNVVLDLKSSFEKRMDALEQRVAALEERMDHVEARLDRIEARLDDHDKCFKRIDEQLDQQQRDLRCVKNILELNIRSDVSIIAENHLNLDRKLNLILKQLEDNEPLSLRVNYLDSEVRKIKSHLKLA